MGDEVPGAKLEFGIVILGAVWGSVPACISSSAWAQEYRPRTRENTLLFPEGQAAFHP